MAREDTHQVILVDGDCALCNGYVRFVSERDPDGLCYFETQQSADGEKLLNKYNQPKDLSTIVMFESVGTEVRGYTKSTAVLRTLRLLSVPWCFLYYFIYIPAIIRDTVYSLVAKYRIIIFGKTTECKLPDKVLRKRMTRTPPALLTDTTPLLPLADEGLDKNSKTR
mmetsp:Transcript_38474/g.46434  ORF Transcript_38474/g.46434 Transcript_38474/m.46434 type:complete len:167 (-) Transcript_38474:414-914(-)